MGYGFIQGATKKPGPDLFFHATECFEPTPKVGERVVYRHGWDPKKQRVMAVEVRYEQIEHEERRRKGGRPAAAASSAVAAGAPASSGSTARSVLAPAEPVSGSVSSSADEGVVHQSFN